MDRRAIDGRRAPRVGPESGGCPAGVRGRSAAPHGRTDGDGGERNGRERVSIAHATRLKANAERSEHPDGHANSYTKRT